MWDIVQVFYLLQYYVSVLLHDKNNKLNDALIGVYLGGKSLNVL